MAAAKKPAAKKPAAKKPAAKKSPKKQQAAPAPKKATPKKPAAKKPKSRQGGTYGRISRQINRDLKNKKVKVRNNQGVRKYAKAAYKKAGLTSSQVKSRMKKKEAGHIKAKAKGGRNRTSNYMWESKRANRAHGKATISKSHRKRAGRMSKTKAHAKKKTVAKKKS